MERMAGRSSAHRCQFSNQLLSFALDERRSAVESQPETACHSIAVEYVPGQTKNWNKAEVEGNCSTYTDKTTTDKNREYVGAGIDGEIIYRSREGYNSNTSLHGCE